MLETPSHRAARSVGRRIKERRGEVAVSQAELAELTQINVSNIGKIERGRTNPRLDSLIRIAVALDTTVSDLTRYVTAEDLPPINSALTARAFVEERTRRATGPER